MIRIELLDKDDEVIGFSENKLAIKKKNGEVEVYIIEIDSNNFPRINNEHLLITFKKGKGKVISQKKNNVERGTF